MNRKELIEKIKTKFSIEELVCKHIAEGYDEKTAWMFLDDKLLETLYALRFNILFKPITVNTSLLNERGIRCNRCDTVKGKNKVYMSAHVLGKAIDFNVEDMDAEEARNIIKEKAYMLPYNVRIENNVSWIHIDVYDNLSGNKITTFNG